MNTNLDDDDWRAQQVAELELLLSISDRHYEGAQRRKNCAHYIWLTLAVAAIAVLYFQGRAGIAFWIFFLGYLAVFRLEAHFFFQVGQIIKETRPLRERLNALRYKPTLNASSSSFHTMSQYGDDVLENFNRAPTNIVSMRVEGVVE